VTVLYVVENILDDGNTAFAEISFEKFFDVFVG